MMDNNPGALPDFLERRFSFVHPSMNIQSRVAKTALWLSKCVSSSSWAHGLLS